MIKNGKGSGPTKSSGDSTKGLAHFKAPAKWRHVHQRLMHLRASLIAGANDLQTESPEEILFLRKPQTGVATGRFDRDLVLSLFSNHRSAIQEVDAALLRIREGTYGICQQSGAMISRERLELIPWARFTAEVQAAIEKEAELQTACFNSIHPSHRPTPG